MANYQPPTEFNPIFDPTKFEAVSLAAQGGTSAELEQEVQDLTTVVNNMIVRGTAGNLITIGSTTTNTAGLTKSSLGMVALDYVIINTLIVAQTNMWYAGANSTSANTTTNWIITDPPARKLGASGVG